MALALPHFLSKKSIDLGRNQLSLDGTARLARYTAEHVFAFDTLVAITAVSLILGGWSQLPRFGSNREKIAVLGIAVGMLPAGFCMIGGVAHLAPYFSLAPAARYLNARLGTTGQVYLRRVA